MISQPRTQDALRFPTLRFQLVKTTLAQGGTPFCRILKMGLGVVVFSVLVVSPIKSFNRTLSTRPSESFGTARDEFVSEYAVPRIITQYQGLLLSTKDYPDFYFLLVKRDGVSDISGCFPNLDHIHCLLLMFCSPFAR